MKTLLLPSMLCLACLPLQAQVTIVTPAPPAPAPPTVVVQQSGPRVVTFDGAVARQHLSLLPKVITLRSPTTSTTTTVTPVPQEIVKTTKTTTVVETPGLPRRVYNSERNVVMVEEQNVSRELPYVTLPVLFVKETAELLDSESRAALEQVASVILEVTRATPGSVFDIEGHTSTDGTAEFNASLSAARAQRVYDELVNRYGVPATALSAHGYGENFPMFPEGTEEQMQQDRRVLVVRTK